MIPRPLIQARVYKGQVRPHLIDPADEALLALAEALRQIHKQGRGLARCELEEAAEVEIAGYPSLRVARGLARVVEDRSEYAARDDVDPAAVRGALFARSAAAWSDGGFDRTGIVADVAAELGMDGAALDEAMYADLRSEQRLTRFRDMSASRLLHRYNVGVLQTVLLSAVRMTVRLPTLTPARCRQLLGSMKFHRLLFTASGDLGGPLTLEIDGPMSLFGPTRQYGLQLAMFLPSALLCRAYSVEAELHWGPRRAARTLALTQALGLRSHYPDRGVWLPEEIRAFPGRFEALGSGWTVSAETALFSLDGRGVAVPDLRFDPPGGGAPVYLELLGHWRRAGAAAHLARLAKHGPPRYLVALSDGLRMDEKEAGIDDARVVRFKQVLLPREVRRALEALGP